MAKRKRLTPAQTDHFAQSPMLETKAFLRPGLSAPPIAQIAGEASTVSALAEVSEALSLARTEGRLMQRLSLAAIDTGYLVRDRLGAEPEEIEALKASLRSHGQRTPIEVTETASGRYGLISGWRRITALSALHTETGEDQFSTVLALLRHPATSGDAYIAMVEENEIRVGLSYYERARIVARSVEQGVFASHREALQKLFATASRAKRSKIGSFLVIYRDLNSALRFPSLLGERLGLSLARRLEDAPTQLPALLGALTADPGRDGEQEAHILTRFLEEIVSEPAQEVSSTPDPSAPLVQSALPTPSLVTTTLKASTEQTPPDPGMEIRPGVFLTVTGGWTKPILTLSGPNVGPEFRERLEAWVKNPR